MDEQTMPYLIIATPGGDVRPAQTLSEATLKASHVALAGMRCLTQVSVWLTDPWPPREVYLTRKVAGNVWIDVPL